MAEHQFVDVEVPLGSRVGTLKRSGEGGQLTVDSGENEVKKLATGPDEN